MSICPSRSRQLRLVALLCGTFLATTATMAPAWSASSGDSSRDASLVTVAQTSLTTPVFEDDNGTDDSADTVSGSRDEPKDQGLTESGTNGNSGSVSGSEGGGNGASDNSGAEDHGGGSQSGGSSGSGSGGGHGSGGTGGSDSGGGHGGGHGDHGGHDD